MILLGYFCHEEWVTSEDAISCTSQVLGFITQHLWERELHGRVFTCKLSLKAFSLFLHLGCILENISQVIKKRNFETFWEVFVKSVAAVVVSHWGYIFLYNLVNCWYWCTHKVYTNFRILALEGQEIVANFCHFYMSLHVLEASNFVKKKIK